MTREPNYRDIADEAHVLRVVSYDPKTGLHECAWREEPFRFKVRIDLMMDISDPKPDPQTLVNQLVKIDYAYEWTWMASGVKVLRSKEVGPL